MVFNAPDVITAVPDIKQIYAVNDYHADQLDEAVESLDGNLLFESMCEENVGRWEKVLGITPADDDTLSVRRYRIQAKMLEKIPYSYRVVLRKLTALCGDGNFTFVIDDGGDGVTVTLKIGHARKYSEVVNLLDGIIPLNMTITVSSEGNSYDTLKQFTHTALSKYSHTQLRDEILEG